MIYCAILAGGKGSRVQKYSIPKQFVSVGGKPLLLHTLEHFINNSRFSCIYLSVHPEWVSFTQDILVTAFSADELKKVKIVLGGKERLDSFLNVITDIQNSFGVNDDDILICHDSVRPFISERIINECIDATLETGNALTIIPTTDTIFKTDGTFLSGTYNRSLMCNGQTPSGFGIKALLTALKNFSEDEKSKITGTMQLLVKAGVKIKAVQGSPANFKITTDKDFDLAQTVLASSYKTKNISVLDCTLRDGGIVIDFNFGNKKMYEIKSALESSGVEYIESGYLDSKGGSSEERSCFDNLKSLSRSFLSHGKKSNVSYLAMIDYGKFDIDSLPKKDELCPNIDGIRLAFHKENAEQAIIEGRKILEKGYELFIQPMVATRYSEGEFRSLIKKVNESLPTAAAFYVVDSFGQMDALMVKEKFVIADTFLRKSMKIGFHAHNNRQLAFSNTCDLLKEHAQHDIIIDSTIMGMGKGAGNLNTELILPIIETEFSRSEKKYDVLKIFSLIRTYFTQLQRTNPWGYSLDYYLSSLYGITPSYIRIFTNDERVTTDILIDLCKNIPEEKKYACDKVFAFKYLKKYFEDNEK